MRFHPIGFEPEPTSSESPDQEMLDIPTSGFLKAGALSSADSSEDEDPSSDAEVPASKPNKKSKTVATEPHKTHNRSGKRKHSEGESKKSKQSSSKSESMTDDRKLKRIKHQVDKRITTDHQLASIESSSDLPTISHPIIHPSQNLHPKIRPPRTGTPTRIIPPVSRTTNASAALASSERQQTTEIRAANLHATGKERTKETQGLKKSKSKSGSISKTREKELKTQAPCQLLSDDVSSSATPAIQSTRKVNRVEKTTGNGHEVNEVRERSESGSKTLLQHSTTPILPPKYTANR